MANTGDRGVGWDVLERAILDETNGERAKLQLKPLEPENVLRETARGHSRDMLEASYFSHVNAAGDGPADRIGKKHRRLIGTVGENLWTGGPNLASAIVSDWMRSTGHRANILNPEYTHLGVGVVGRGEELRVTQNFATVRALLDRELPERLTPQSRVGLAASGPAPVAEMFDFVRAGERGPPQPGLLREARVPDAAGLYRLRFYFREKQNQYRIFEGPEVKVE